MRHVFTDIETTGLYPFVHRIVCIGWACEGKKRTIVDRDERGMLQQFLDFLQPGDTLVGYNFDFDYGFLVLRCLKHGVNPQKLIFCERIDLMKPIKALIEAKGVSLQTLADFFGFEYEKTSGKKIPEFWENGDYEAIKRHCLSDVGLAAQLFERLKPLLFEPATEKQKRYLLDLGVKFDETLTKSEASRLIDEARGSQRGADT